MFDFQKPQKLLKTLVFFRLLETLTEFKLSESLCTSIWSTEKNIE